MAWSEIKDHNYFTPIDGLFILRYVLKYDHKYRESLVTMPYKFFLKTDYWKIIKNYVNLYYGYRCQICNKKSISSHQVHHKTYEFRGMEYLDIPKSLTLLCKDCHSKFHDRLDRLEENKYGRTAK